MTSTQHPPEPDLYTGDQALNAYLREHATGDGLLGSLVLLQVGEVEPITHTELCSWFGELELDPEHLPNPPRAADAYERATGTAKSKYPLDGGSGRKKQTHEKTGKTVTLMMRHVVRDETRIVRHLVRELADHADESLSYEVKLAEAQFVRTIGATVPVGSGTMTLTAVEPEIERLSAFERATIAALITQIEDDYDKASRHIPSPRISKMLREYLEDSLAAIRIQPGAYFVPRQHSEPLDALRDLAQRCDAKLTRIPLPDTIEQRAMVGDAFSAKTSAGLDSLARDIAREQTGGPAAYRVAKLHRRFLEIKREAEQYRDNLGAELGDTDARLDLINAQMAQLLMTVPSDTGDTE